MRPQPGHLRHELSTKLLCDSPESCLCSLQQRGQINQTLNIVQATSRYHAQHVQSTWKLGSCQLTFLAFAAASSTGSEAAASVAGSRPTSSPTAASNGGSGRLALGVSAGSEHAMLQMFVTSLYPTGRLICHCCFSV